MLVRPSESASLSSFCEVQPHAALSDPLNVLDRMPVLCLLTLTHECWQADCFENENAVVAGRVFKVRMHVVLGSVELLGTVKLSTTCIAVVQCCNMDLSPCMQSGFLRRPWWLLYLQDYHGAEAPHDRGRDGII